MTTNSTPAMDRRTFLKTATLAGVAAGATATTAASPVRAAGDEFTQWFANVDNYAGIEDRRGESEVSVAVGAPGNNGAFAFGPAAVRVDPGTTVRWEWSGKGGGHNVVASDGAFGSDLVDDAGHTFEHAFESTGVTYYVCEPHAAMGMKGAVVVGDATVGVEYIESEPPYGDWFDGVGNYEGTVDRTGQERVTVKVGAPGNGGALAFEPAAVAVDPGTTVVWEWTGEGGDHDVVDADHGFESPVQSAAGATYALTFDGVGISKYVCTSGADAGMKGAVVVGDPMAGVPVLTEGERAMLGGLWGTAALPVLFGGLLWWKRTRGRRGDDGSRPQDDPETAA